MHHSLHSNHYYGMVISYIFSSLLVAFFAIKMTMNNRKQDILIQEITQKFNQNLIVSEYGLAAANAAHDLGTPLGTMNLLIDDIIDDYPSLKKDDRYLKTKKIIKDCKILI